MLMMQSIEEGSPLPKSQCHRAETDSWLLTAKALQHAKPSRAKLEAEWLLSHALQRIRDPVVVWVVCTPVRLQAAGETVKKHHDDDVVKAVQEWQADQPIEAPCHHTTR